ncbi:MAG: 4-hydroxy-tetrahydrodipicolinate reductase [Mariprofundaceae bacterium]|nr:4-hydroxy-tetrahydrodipicolinate reductase [Mariprofundaceae bacterium]
MSTNMRVIVTGAPGRMGRMLVQAVSDASGAELVAATERPGSEYIGRDAGEVAGIQTLGIPISDDFAACHEADVLIDFTTPAATLAHARVVAGQGMRMVIGTTGFDDAQLRELREILSDVPVVMAANYSVGVNLALQLIRQAASVLGPEYDAEIFEAHHRHKVDAPSGTALAMGRAVSEGRGVDFDQAAVFSREGLTGERKAGAIGFAVVRAGGIVGEHRAMLIAEEERLEIGHIAADRMAFARGAVRAAAWLHTQSSGWYDMLDVLGLAQR